LGEIYKKTHKKFKKNPKGTKNFYKTGCSFVYIIYIKGVAEVKKTNIYFDEADDIVDIRYDNVFKAVFARLPPDRKI